MYRNLIRLFVLLFCAATFSLKGEIRGKVDAGPTLIWLDILKSGKTEDTIKMYGVKADSTVLIYKNIAVKPSLLLGWGHGRVVSGSIAAGCYYPLTESFKILPHVGINWSYLTTRIDMEAGPLSLHNVKERFRSQSPFIGIDLSYSITPKWTIIGCYQYAWCKTDTKLTDKNLGTFVNDRSHSCGPNYSLGIDYTLNDQWSFNLGFAYNIALSKEKHGIRGKGMRLAASYYF